MQQLEKINILKDLIKINSANGNEKQVSTYLKTLLNRHGIEDVQLIPYDTNRMSIIANIGDPTAKRVLALAGHLDTVAIGNIDNWKHDPFSALEENGTIYGRGSADMKSGLAAMVITMIELHESKTNLNGQLRFIGTVGEELGAMGARDLTSQGAVHDIDAMIVGEPTSGDIIFAHSGSFNYTVNSYGKGAHSSLPQFGNNAITNLTKFIIAEQTAFDGIPTSDVLGPLVHSVTVINGGQQVNSIPEFAQLQGNIRPIPEFNPDQVTKRLQDTIDKLNQEPQNHLELVVNNRFEPVVNDPNSDFVQLIQRARTAAFSQPAKLDVIHGATDASEYIKDDHHFPMIVLGAGNWNDAHSVDETVSVDNYLKVLETYKNVAVAYLQ
ncbi:ArgE/DapE family deacylase [Paucilactobacillus sp. N302-9]